MNVLFFTQSRSLDVFHQILLRLRRRTGIGKAGFYVANLPLYEAFTAAHPGFEADHPVVKEWEIYAEADGKAPDMESIRRFEREIGNPTLWDPIVTDRRLFLGTRATYRQDYRPQFTREQTLAVLDSAMRRIERLFDEVRPDLVCTLYTATFGDCLGHMFAKARGIKSLDLRLARLKNYVMMADGMSEPPDHIASIHRAFADAVPEDLASEASAYAESVRTQNAMYEGVVPAAAKRAASAKKPPAAGGTPLWKLPAKAIAFAAKYRRFDRPPYRYDYQVPGLIEPVVYRRYLNPLNHRWIRRRLAGELVREKDLKGMDYALYPLHTEPELVLSQFARPFLNQIEVIRNFRMALPVGMTLLVKDHPMMSGRRPLSYYRKLLEIPGVRLVDMDLPSEAVLANARLVYILRGAIGLEAVIKRIPVVSLGKSLFDLLPPHMFRVCRNLYELPEATAGILAEYRYDHPALVRYLAAVIKGSVSANLVSDLLGKAGRFRTETGGGTRFEDHPHLDVLADYLLRRFGDGDGGREAPAREPDRAEGAAVKTLGSR